MRISYFLTVAALTAACITGCSKKEDTTGVAAGVKDLGTVDFTDNTPKYFSLSGQKSCTITGVADAQNITLTATFQQTNADSTVQDLGKATMLVPKGRPCILTQGDISVEVMPKF